MIDRRTFALSSLAVAACVARTQAPDAPFRETVDQLAAIPAPARWATLQSVRRSTLGPQDLILYETISPGIEAEAVLARLPYGANALPYAVTQRNGAYRNPRASVAEIAHETERLNTDAAQGVIAPDFVLAETIPLVETAGAETHGARAEALTAQAQTLHALHARATNEASLARLPHGEAFYRAALQVHLGAASDPHRAHANARARCVTLHAEADALLRGQGLTRGGVAERLGGLLRDPRQRYPDTEAARAAALADMHAVLARAPALLAPAFASALPSVQIRALPASEEAGGSRGRREGGAYIVDLGGARARATLASVVYHETIPGHLLQAPFEAAANVPVLQRRYAGGYSEGWAIYAEQLADELGGFADPLSRIGYLHWMLFRMARIVADTGMHALGWSRARAIDEMHALQRESIAFVSIEEDVGRIAAQPGIAAAQGLAALHIAEARARWRSRDLSLQQFHSAMLQHGPLSPPGLDQALRAVL